MFTDFNSATEGAAITTATTGLPANPALGTGGTALHKASAAIEGAFGGEFLNGSAGSCLQRITPGTTDVTCAFSVGVTLPATLSATEREVFYMSRSTTGSPQIGRATSGNITLSDTAGTNFVTINGGTTIVNGGKYLLIGLMNLTTGKYDIDLRSGTSPYALINNVNNTASGTYALGATAYSSADYGRVAGTARQIAYGIDYATFSVGTTTKPSIPSGAVPAVSIAVTSVYLDAGSTLTLDGTLTGTANTIKWTNIVKPAGVSTPAIANDAVIDTTVPNMPAGFFTFQLDASNAVGPATPATVNVYVAQTPGTTTANNVPIRSVTTTWSNFGGAADIRTAISDGSATTGMQSPTPAAGQTATILLGPLGLGPIGGYIDGYYSDAGVHVTCTLYAENGTTVIDSDEWDLTSTNAGHEFLVDTAGITALTGANDAATKVLRRALIVVISATAI